MKTREFEAQQELQQKVNLVAKLEKSVTELEQKIQNSEKAQALANEKHYQKLENVNVEMSKLSQQVSEGKAILQ